VCGSCLLVVNAHKPCWILTLKSYNNELASLVLTTIQNYFPGYLCKTENHFGKNCDPYIIVGI
jgi:hypothetical protein